MVTSSRYRDTFPSQWRKSETWGDKNREDYNYHNNNTLFLRLVHVFEMQNSDIDNFKLVVQLKCSVELHFVNSNKTLWQS